MHTKKNIFMKNWIAPIIIISLFAACSPKTSTTLNAPQPQWETKTPVETPIEVSEESTEEVSEEPVKKGQFEKNVIAAAPIVVVGLKREACYGKCPAFELKLYNDGTIKYHGKSNVKNLGYFIAYAGKETVVDIQTKAETMGYFGLNSQYPPSGKPQIYDMPQTTTFVKVDNKEHRITNRHDSPAALFKFENHIESVVENLDWKPIRYDEF